MTATHTYIDSTDVAVCDFCCRPDVPVAWKYPCTTTIVQELGPFTTTSTDAWGACAECSLVIDRKDPAALAVHVIALAQGEEAEAMRAIPALHAMLVEKIRDLYVKLLPALGEKNTDTALPPEGARSILVVHGDDHSTGAKR